MRRGLTGRVDEDERGLRHDTHLVPDAAGLVDDVWERADTEVVDERPDRIEAVTAGDADEGDLVSVLLLDLCDRRGFTSTDRSPRRPEPQQNILTLERVEVELGAIGERHENDICFGRRCGCRYRLGRRCLGAGVATATRGKDDRSSRADGGCTDRRTELHGPHRTFRPTGHTADDEEFTSRFVSPDHGWSDPF